MSIKNAIRRLEIKMTNNSSSYPMTFIVPYSKDQGQANKIEQELLQNKGLKNSNGNGLVIFVIDFAQVV